MKTLPRPEIIEGTTLLIKRDQAWLQALLLWLTGSPSKELVCPWLHTRESVHQKKLVGLKIDSVTPPAEGHRPGRILVTGYLVIDDLEVIADDKQLRFEAVDYTSNDEAIIIFS